LFNKKEIIKTLKIYGATILSILVIFSIYQYSQLIGFTKIKNIRISGNNFIEQSTIEDQLNIEIDTDLLFFDIAKNQQKLNEIDFIKCCRMSRVFPSTLIIEIIENDPIAHVKTLENEFIMDKDGTPLPYNLNIVNYFALPKVRINNSIDVSHHESNDVSKDLGNKLNKLQIQYPQIYNRISEFHFKEKGDVVMDFAKSTKIIAQNGNLNLHFKILEEFNVIKHNLSFYSIIDLRVKDQLIVMENRYQKS